MNQRAPRPDRPVLLTGATGYVGGRLLQRLEARRFRVRCLARRPEVARARAAATTEVCGGDVLDPASLRAALEGVDAACYLVHSMGARGSFEEKDRAGARNFAAAARAAGIRRIIYLGGLGEGGGPLSPHLRSRQEVGEILRRSGVETIELRASIVIGSGSLSFEVVRALTERLPVMITPRWVSVPAQPIAIDDLLDILVAALDVEIDGSRVFEIGGADVVSYRDIMREYARQRGLRRLMIRVPVLTPKLSSLWLGLVTPLYARVGRALIDSIRHPTVVREPVSPDVFGVTPMGLRQAMARALRNEDEEIARTHWSDAFSSGGEMRQWGGVRFGGRLVDSRTVDLPVPPAAAFAPVRRIGGDRGWYFADGLWTLRGWLDLLAGGAGMRRGRRDPERVRIGDPIDCWRVEALEPDHRLRLQAEMRLPGRAWLEFTVDPVDGGARLRQTAIFDPVGLAGLAYWYLIYPLHQLVFAGMLRGIAAAARRSDEGAPPGATGAEQS